jgi:hypothetical protein
MYGFLENIPISNWLKKDTLKREEFKKTTERNIIANKTASNV